LAKRKKKKIDRYKDRENFSEQTIQRVLYDHFKDMNYKMSNVYMFGGKTATWECDFFFVAKNRQLWEIEIKVDRQDFDRDFQYKKKKHHLLREAYATGSTGGVVLPNAFYFCAPEGIIKHEKLPEYAGLLEIHGENKDQVRYVGSNPRIHQEVRDVTDLLLTKFYNKTLSMEKMLSDFRINLFENPEDESEIVRKFLKRIRM
jgi:hypothetical protein